jgi:hypothetical protein
MVDINDAKWGFYVIVFGLGILQFVMIVGIIFALATSTTISDLIVSSSEELTSKSDSEFLQWIALVTVATIVLSYIIPMVLNMTKIKWSTMIWGIISGIFF